MELTNSDEVKSDARDTKAEAPSFIIYGKRGGRTYAAQFDGQDPELAAKAAALMGLRILGVTNEELGAIASKLPASRIYASGKSFCPMVSAKLFEQLEAMGGEVPSPPATVQSGEGEGKLETTTEEPAEGSAPISAPTTWDAITVGSVVLATEGRPMEGWFEVVVTAAKPNDLFVVKWRDFPDDKPFVRKRGHLALLPPDAAAEKSPK